MKKIKIGVLGAGRGSSMIHYGELSGKTELVAVCDKNEVLLEAHKNDIKDDRITYYTDFEEFLKHDMEAVVLANYANEHAPFAIRCLENGLHVFSEVLPCQNMAEAVALIEAVEKSGKVYAYGENYCYMPAPVRMKKLYREGKIGEFEYGEGEYIHNCEPIWADITYGQEEHWRNNMYATFYCTHSLGPIIHSTGLRPVSVVGFEGICNARCMRMGYKSGIFGIEMVTLENGGIVRSTHGNLYRNSVWYSMYGSKGVMESAREIARNGDTFRLYVDTDAHEGDYNSCTYEDISIELEEIADGFGHGGSDYYCIDEFIKKINGDNNADTIDVYEALDMFLPGLLAYRSVLNGGVSVEIPNLRNPEERERYRNDTACSDAKAAGDMLVPSYSKGNPTIEPKIYEEIKKKYEKSLAEGGSSYYKAMMAQGKKPADEKKG